MISNEFAGIQRHQVILSAMRHKRRDIHGV